MEVAANAGGGMKEETPAVKTEVETDTDVAGDGMTKMKEEAPAVRSEMETDTDVAENRPTAGCECYSADELAVKTEVKIEIDVAENPYLYCCKMAEQHTHDPGCRSSLGQPQRVIKSLNKVTSTSSRDASVQCPAPVEELSGGGGKGKKCKRHCCPFCQKFNVKMSTHLQRRHKDEPEVARILAMTKGNRLRRQAFIKLQDLGDYQHNWRVLSSNEGSLVPKYRQKQGPKSNAAYVACIYCKALYQKKLLSKHVRRCLESPEGDGKLGGLLLPIPHGTKKHCCPFCQKFNVKMSTHLQRRHKDEPEVARILAMTKGNRLRRQAFIKLQDLGDYQHNWRVLSSNEGSLVPKYRQKQGPKSNAAYVPCIYCKALYQTKLLSTHVRRCLESPEGDGKRMKKGKCHLLGKLLLPIPHGTSAAFFEKVVGKMKEDEISRVVRNDSLLLKYGERLFSRSDKEEHSSAQMSCRLRELGRLSKILGNMSGMKVSTITQAIDPVNFDMLIKAVHEIGEFSTSTNMCKKGSLVLKLGYSLKKCSDILKAEAIKQNDTDGSDKCQRFESLYKGDWSDRVSACASQSVQRAKMNKPKLLPSLADVEKVNHELEKDLTSESYPILAKAVLAYVTVFNRKRGGKVQRMKMKDYRQGKKCEMSNPDKEILQNLTATEKKLVGVLPRVEIREKFNRPVPVLLTPKMVEGIDRMLALRSLLGIDSDYLFVSQTGEQPYRVSTAIKAYAIAAKVSDAALFAAPALRKQLSTLSQSLVISNFNQDHLATFLGHDLRVDRNIYRQPLEMMQKARVASILFKVNKGATSAEDSEDVLEDEEIDTEDPNEELEDSDDSDNLEVDSVDKGRDNDVSAQESEYQVTDVSASNQPCSCSVSSTNPQKARQKIIVNKKKKKKKKMWSDEEIGAVRRHLNKCISGNRVPQKHEAEKALFEEPVLRQRNWKDIKYCVYNMLQRVRQNVIR